MKVLIGFVLVALACGCTAFPTSEEKDLSVYFNYVNPSAKLVGGQEASEGAHPHMVAFTTGSIFRSFQCGGSIITFKHILTAAHCVHSWYSRGSLTSSLRATVGTNRWNSGGTSYHLSRNVSHPNYIQQLNKNDIAFVLPSSDIVLSDRIRPVTLNYGLIGAGEPVVVAGWGRTTSGGSFSSTLREISTRTIDGQRCVAEARESLLANGHSNPPPVEPHIELCTFHSAGVGICQGDGGSALLHANSRQQIGIVSWGVPCAVGGPDMYTRLNPYFLWAVDVITGDW